MFVTDDPKSGRWFLGDDPPPTPAELRSRVRDLIKEVAEGLDLTLSEFVYDKSAAAVDSRARVAVIADEYLRPYLSTVDIAVFLGIPRATFVFAKRRWESQHKETTVGFHKIKVSDEYMSRCAKKVVTPVTNARSYYPVFFVEGSRYPNTLIRFADIDDAKKYAEAKFTAWTMADDWEVCHSDDEPRYHYNLETGFLGLIDEQGGSPCV